MYIITCAMCKLHELALLKSTAETLAWNHILPESDYSQPLPNDIHHHVLVINEEDLLDGGTP